MGPAELCELIYDGPYEAQPWSRFVRTLRHRLGASAVGLTLQQPATIRPLLLFTLDGDFDNAHMMERYLGRFSDEDPFPYHDLKTLKAYTLEDFLKTNGNIEAYRQDFLHPFGIDHMLLSRIEASDGSNAYLFICRTEQSQPFDCKDVELVEAILPAFRPAIRVASSLRRECAARRVYENAIEAMGIGTILLNVQGHVIYSNPISKALLANQNMLLLRNEKLSCTRNRERAMLAELIDKALADSTGQFSHALPLTTDGSSELLLLIRAVAYPLCESNEPGPRVAIFLNQRGARAAVPRDLIRDLFNLSRAEADLSMVLSDGKTLAQAAELLHISEHTARTYSKRIYAKTGTNRQAELVQLILSSVAMLGGRHISVN